MTGGAMGMALPMLFGLPQTVKRWDTDPYAGRRYLTNVALGGLAGQAKPQRIRH